MYQREIINPEPQPALENAQAFAARSATFAPADLVGSSFAVLRRHYFQVIKTLSAPMIAACLGGILLQACFVSEKESESWSLFTFALSMLIIALAKWSLTMRQLAFVRVFSGFAETYESAYRHLSRRKWEVLGICLLGFVAFIMVVVFFAACSFAIVALVVIPRNNPSLILATLGAISLSVVIVVASALVFICGFGAFMGLTVIACEDLDFFASVGRGIHLCLSAFWHSLGFALMLSVVIVILTYPLSLPLLAVSIFDVFRQGLSPDSYQMPLYMVFIGQIWESILNILLWPVIYLSYGFFYLDWRVHHEGFDLAMRLSRLETFVKPEGA